MITELQCWPSVFEATAPPHLPYRMAQARRCKTIADILHVTNLKCECRKHVSTGHREGVLPARYNHKGH